MRKIILLTALLTFSALLSAQDEEGNVPAFQNELGIHAGFSTGVGLSFRHWVQRNGVQFTFIPIKADDFVFISGGVTFLRNFYESKYVRVYGYIGNHLYYTNDYWTEEVYDYNSGTWTYIDHEEDRTKYNIGFGPGFSFGRRVQFNIMAGYGLYDVTGSFNMLPTGEMGLYFRF